MNSMKKGLMLLTVLSLFLTACGGDDSTSKDGDDAGGSTEKESNESKGEIFDKVLACIEENKEVELTEAELEEFVTEAGGDASANSFRDDTTRVYLDQGDDAYTSELVLTKTGENTYENCYIVTKAEEVVKLEGGGNVVINFNGGFNSGEKKFIFIPSLYLLEDATNKFLTTFSFDEEAVDLEYISGDEELNDEEFIAILAPVAEESNEFNRMVFKRTFAKDRD